MAIPVTTGNSKKAVLISAFATLETEASDLVVERPKKEPSKYRVSDEQMKSNLLGFLRFADLKMVKGSTQVQKNQLSVLAQAPDGKEAYVNSGRYGIVRFCNIAYKPEIDGTFEVWEDPKVSSAPVEDTPF